LDSFAYPQRNLPGRAEDWGRAVEAQQRILSKEVRQVNQAWENSARATGGQLAVIASQIDTVTAQQDELAGQQASLEDLLARVEDASKVFATPTGGIWTGTGWAPSAPQVTAQSRSGRFRVSVGGSASGGTVVFTFQTTGYPRDRALGGSTAAARERVTSFGGASMIGSAFKSWIIELTPLTDYVFSAQANSPDNFTSVIAPYLQVEPLL
jgi:hypothetical protein